MSKVKLCDICDFQGGSQPPKSQWITLQQDGYIRMLQIRDFTQPGKVKEEYVKLTNTTKCCLKDDILIARYGASLGKILTGLSGAYNVAMTKAVPNEAVISKKFLYYFLCSDTFQNCILNVGVRAAQAGFNKEDLSNIEIYCPDLSIQNKICKILELVDVLINKSKLQLDELDLLVKSRFIEMFGESNYPLVKACDVCDFITKGTTPNTKEIYENYTDERIPFLKVYNLSNTGKLLFKNKTQYIDNSVHNGELSRSIVFPNDVLMNIVGPPLGKFAIVDDSFPEWNVNQAIAIFRAKREILPLYLLYSLMQDDILSPFLQKAVGVRQLNISLEQCRELQFRLPPLNLQHNFSVFAQQVDKSKLAIQQSLDELETLKKSLMQQYFG